MIEVVFPWLALFLKLEALTALLYSGQVDVGLPGGLELFKDL